MTDGRSNNIFLSNAGSGHDAERAGTLALVVGGCFGTIGLLVPVLTTPSVLGGNSTNLMDLESFGIGLILQFAQVALVALALLSLGGNMADRASAYFGLIDASWPDDAKKQARRSLARIAAWFGIIDSGLTLLLLATMLVRIYHPQVEGIVAAGVHFAPWVVIPIVGVSATFSGAAATLTAASKRVPESS